MIGNPLRPLKLDLVDNRNILLDEAPVKWNPPTGVDPGHHSFGRLGKAIDIMIVKCRIDAICRGIIPIDQ